MSLTLCRPTPPYRPPTCPRADRSPSPSKFRSPEEAWFWTMAALAARHNGSRREKARILRPCDPDDVVRCLDQLYRDGHVGLVHARILRLWGERQTAPDARFEGEIFDHRIWRETMDRLDQPLRAKGIID